MKWLNNFNIAIEDSSKTNKPILLQFEMEGCGGCKKLYNETYTDPQVEQEMTDWFILLKLDLIKDRQIRKEYAGYWTPSLYFLDNKGKSYFNFNGFLPPEEFRVILRLGYAELMIPKGKYDEAIEIMSNKIIEFRNSVLLPKLLLQIAVAKYIKTKDKNEFKKTMKEIQATYPNSLEAKMYFQE
ncbi:MAG: thioredoxin family protein [Ignavibacteria bacterium]|nr:thioredoxin family protein [Ignavibacteria bacterium]